MGILDPVKPSILAVRIISNVDSGFAAKLGLGDSHRVLGLVAFDSDDALYISLDEAPKFAEVEAVYAKSFYADSHYPTGSLPGEIIGMLHRWKRPLRSI